VRVIAGTARGRRLATPKGSRVRPTADRVKEALFNILASTTGGLGGYRVLDLCAGTGNLGIEALSRGAAAAVFVDSSRESAAVIRKNLELTGFADRSRVLVQDALTALRVMEGSEQPFDLVFLDPPYEQEILPPLLVRLGGSPLLVETATVVVEFSARETVDERYGRLARTDRRTYGDTVLAFFTAT
jgi:16S rRNA (guanine(966)-N(2))-methyltransferase RsmD